MTNGEASKTTCFLFLLSIGLFLFGTYHWLGVAGVCIAGSAVTLFAMVCWYTSNDCEPKRTKQETGPPLEETILDKGARRGPFGYPTEEQARKEQIHTGVTRPAKGAKHWADDHDLPG